MCVRVCVCARGLQVGYDGWEGGIPKRALGKGSECGTELYILGTEINLIWLEGRA